MRLMRNSVILFNKIKFCNSQVNKFGGVEQKMLSLISTSSQSTIKQVLYSDIIEVFFIKILEISRA